ncbi:TfuA-like protein [Streptomyces sp. NPDC051172]|uniref:TfuA-like protein n=1 Tax=Streptomyces sp. NPDC051172 TaxID=3155796 RepID=UPI00343AD2B4
MDPVVFLGPSLDRATAVRTLDAEYLPPVARGDIDALLARPQPPCLIGIVDGRFLGSLAVSPKEVLRAVDAGIAVYGSSSMGALRAAECGPFGVTGIGRIHDAYACGAVDADDEVALVYDPDTLHATSEPLINLRSPQINPPAPISPPSPLPVAQHSPFITMLSGYLQREPSPEPHGPPPARWCVRDGRTFLLPPPRRPRGRRRRHLRTRIPPRPPRWRPPSPSKPCWTR